MAKKTNNNKSVNMNVIEQGAINMTNEMTINGASAVIGGESLPAFIPADVPESTVDVDALLANYNAAVAALNAAGVKVPNTKKAKAVVDDSAIIAEIEQFAAEWTPAQFSKRVKPLSNAGIEQLAQNAGVRLWSEMTNPAIRRMRQIMELKAAYYPVECGHLSAGKAKSAQATGFKALSTDKLLEACRAHGLTVNTCEDDKINRMRATMLLKAVGVDAESLSA